MKSYMQTLFLCVFVKTTADKSKNVYVNWSSLIIHEGLLTDKSNLPVEDEDDERNLNYNPPAQKSLQEIQELDKEDESLVKYKQTLLGPEALTAGVCLLTCGRSGDSL